MRQAAPPLLATPIHPPFPPPSLGTLPRLQDTRPWRLHLPGVHYICVDQPDVMELKLRLLARAGAQTASNAAVAGSFPLTCGSWAGVGADLGCVSLADALARGGFRPGSTTIWTAEALIYYLHLPQAG